jgi:hypothetical protein
MTLHSHCGGKGVGSSDGQLKGRVCEAGTAGGSRGEKEASFIFRPPHHLIQ